MDYLIEAELSIKESPRERLYRFNAQLESIQRTCPDGYSRSCCPQDICCICYHLSVFKSQEGDVDADCMVNAKHWKEGDKEILHCRKFRAIDNWHIKIVSILNDIMYDYCERLQNKVNEYKSKNITKEENILRIYNMSEISFKESTRYFRLLDLERKLKAIDYNVLDLKYLDLLRIEVEDRLKEFHNKHKGEHF
jgi:hypothetical protein